MFDPLALTDPTILDPNADLAKSCSCSCASLVAVGIDDVIIVQ